MLISNDKATERLSSPGNLFNRLRSNSKSNNSMSLFMGVKETPKSTAVLGFVNKVDIPQELEVSHREVKNEVKVPDLILPSNSQALPEIDNLLNDVESKIKLESIASSALSTLHASIEQLKNNLSHLPAAKLPDVAVKMSKVITDIRSKQSDTNEKSVHLHFYAPERRKLEDYQEVVA